MGRLLLVEQEQAGPPLPRQEQHRGYASGVGLGKGKTEHAGPRDMSRKHGHWGYTEEAKEWASRARRRDEAEEIEREVVEAEQDPRDD